MTELMEKIAFVGPRINENRQRRYTEETVRGSLVSAPKKSQEKRVAQMSTQDSEPYLKMIDRISVPSRVFICRVVDLEYGFPSGPV